MKRNPCRYCILGQELRGKYYPKYSTECGSCENLKKHREYLEKHRKFFEGEPICQNS